MAEREETGSMDISREFGGRLDQYRRDKPLLPVGIFGSFYRYGLLGSLRDHLNDHGYHAQLSIDLEELIPRKKGEDKDVYNFRISRELIIASAICIFVVFREHDGESNVNQSVSQEAQYLYDRQAEVKRPALFRALVLVEDGSKPASLFRGLMKSSHPRWNEAPFVTEVDLYTAARQFCWNVVGDETGG